VHKKSGTSQKKNFIYVGYAKHKCLFHLQGNILLKNYVFSLYYSSLQTQLLTDSCITFLVFDPE
jgi:hypothetical protein